jgi:hypothetical protein
MKTLLAIIAIAGIMALVFSFTSCTKEEIKPIIDSPVKMLQGKTYQIQFSGNKPYLVKFLENENCVITNENVNNAYVSYYKITGTLYNFNLKVDFTGTQKYTEFINCKFLFNDYIASDFKDVLTPDYTFQLL